MKALIRTQFRNKLRSSSAVFAFMLAVILVSAPVFAEVDPTAEFDTESNSWEDWPEGPELWARTACLIDAGTGAVLFAKGANEQRYPASITKIMTAIVVLDKKNPDDIITISENTAQGSFGTSSSIDAVAGEQFTVEQCLKMLLLRSADDVAVQLAETVSGSQSAFAELMNDRALRLGCMNTRFTDPCGLENEDQYTSAYDMCLIMQEAVRNDVIRGIFVLPSIDIPANEFSEERHYENHIYLMQQGSPYYYEGCFGGKTGYTGPAESTFVCAAQKDGVVLIGTVMGAQDTGTASEDMVDLFDYGFNNYEQMSFAGEDTEEPEEDAEEKQTEETEESSEETTEEVSSEEEEEVSEQEPWEPPVAVTTSEPKAKITDIPKEEETRSSVRTIVYIILLCVLAVSLTVIAVLEIRVMAFRRKNQKRKR